MGTCTRQGQLENNYFTQVNRYDVYDNFLGRLDLNFSSRNRFFVSVGQYARTGVSGDLFHNVATGGGSDWPMWNAAIDDTHVVSPALVLNGRLGFTRYTQDSAPRSFGFDPAQLGSARRRSRDPRCGRRQGFRTLSPDRDEIRRDDDGTAARTGTAAKVISLLAALGDERGIAPGKQKTYSIFAHLVAGRSIDVFSKNGLFRADGAAEH